MPASMVGLCLSLNLSDLLSQRALEVSDDLVLWIRHAQSLQVLKALFQASE